MRNNPKEFIFCEDCFVKLHTSFRTLSEDQIHQLNYEKACNLYKRGDTVYHEGHRGNGVYCVNKGVLKLYKTGIDGKEQIIRFAKAGDLIGFRSVISDEISCTTSKVIEDAVLCFIPAKLFVQLAKDNAEFSMHLIKLSCKELGEANKYILDLAQKNLRERVAEVLVLLYDTFELDDDNNIKVSLTREEVANIVGTATESVIRQLSDFKKEKVIDLKGRRIKILDINKLKKISGIF
ncbi:MAG: Crp/Fnr family transcriptional regulator [Bacteroidales bacterium]|nr:Crp/Fnr family transcriptional regulator [Bacteroidales bacterium]